MIGGGSVGSSAVWLLIELEIRKKNARAALNKAKPVVPNCKVFSQLMTSEVRSNTRSGILETKIFGVPSNRL